MDNNNSHDRAEEVALFRFSVISENASPRLPPAERGLIVRALARAPVGAKPVSSTTPAPSQFRTRPLAGNVPS